MFFAGFLFGLFYFWKEIVRGFKAKEQEKRMLETLIYGQSHSEIWKTK